ncbi:MAG TPA: sigma-70 family RNA polymerase sigma factor, partial [Candidatus Binatia bacterium]|nr:sigma-70 family RNA polymerase sigma factor [Candidatus Binatia bacterium]
NVSLNLRRDEFRRHSRESQAMKDLDPNHQPAPDWDHLRPILDEALSELNEADHDALVLRYFKNHDLRTVGSALGVSDDTAQKRVSRALEKLRDGLSRRGITASAAALSVALAANAVQAAPVGLVSTVSSAAALAGTTVQSSSAIVATKAIAMTTLQKTLVTAVFAVALGTGIYQTQQASRLRQQIQTLRQQHSEQIQELQRQRDEATTRVALLADENGALNNNSAELLKLRGEVSRLKAVAEREASASLQSTAKSWLDRVGLLKQRLEEVPDSKIPELQLLTEQDWLSAARGDLNSEADYRHALSTLRSAGENKFASMLKKALSGYLHANTEQFPTELAQLQPYFDAPIDGTMLQRWEIAPAQTVKSLGLGGDVIITQKAAVDDVFDTQFGIGPNGYGTTDFLSHETAAVMNPVRESFRAAHNGQWPADNSQLLPYVTTPEQQSALQKLLLRDSSSK